MLVVLAIALAWGLSLAIEWPGFHPKNIGVGGTRVVAPNLIRQTARISTSDNIWLLNPWAIQSRIEAIPYVKTVRLQRALPNRVRLVVTERQPAFCLRGASGKLVTSDVTQRILNFGCLSNVTYDVPKLKISHLGETVADDDLARLQTIAGTFHDAGMSLKHLALDRDDGAVVQRSDGVVFLLGDDTDLLEKVRLVGPIITASKSHGQNVEQLDLRSLDTPVARYRENKRTPQNVGHK